MNLFQQIIKILQELKVNFIKVKWILFKSHSIKISSPFQRKTFPQYQLFDFDPHLGWKNKSTLNIKFHQETKIIQRILTVSE